MFRTRIFLPFLVALGLAGFLRAGSTPAPTPGTEFHDRLREIAGQYSAWHRVDDEAHWAPELCRRPKPAQVQVSRSKDEETHGQKLYSLFARERKAYLNGAEQPVGQVLVKQSWVPEEIQVDAPRLSKEVPSGEKEHFVRLVTKDGKLYLASKQADLFVMFKTDPKTPNTDEGWVYGTVSPDGKTVTSAGRVESCMACHKDAAKDRMFGVNSKTR